MTTENKLWAGSDLQDVQTIIRAVYRQVLGNPHIMESERLVTAESQLCDGSMTVRDFVRAVAQSDFYRRRYFESCAPYRFIELNFKHLLGRAPNDQAEISEHIRICVEQGYEAEMDSYIDSDEYQAWFGDSVVPYYRTTSQVGQKQVGYNNILSLIRGNAEIDSAATFSRLVGTVSANRPPVNRPVPQGRQNKNLGEKTFKIVVKGSTPTNCNRAAVEYVISGSQMSKKMQQINRSRGKIVSITQVS